MTGIKMGTRASGLALAQSKQFAAEVEKVTGQTVELVEFRTDGDKIQDRPLYEIGGKGLFVREIEEALAAEQIDFAVHSLKDLPFSIAPGMQLAIYPKRESPFDVLIGDQDAPGVIGTGSPRRALQLARKYGNARFNPIRGNIDTRLRKLADPEWDLQAIVLAHSGMRRYGLETDQPVKVLTADECLPSVCQGVLGIEVREGSSLVETLAPLDDADTRISAEAERLVLKLVQADCTLPVAAFAVREGDDFRLQMGLWKGAIGKDGQLIGDRSEVLWDGLIDGSVAGISRRSSQVEAAVEELRGRGGEEILRWHEDQIAGGSH